MSNQLCLLAAFAHPDDEGLVTGLFKKYREAGARVALICATRGEVGEIAPGTNATHETLGQVREQELRKAMSYVDVSEIYFLDYRDSGMDGTEENRTPNNFINTPEDEVAGKVVNLIRTVKPHVLITFDPSGGYGHPDHLKIHGATMTAWAKAGDASAYPEQFQNGLQPHTPQKLYWTAFSREFFMEIARHMKEAGMAMAQFGAFNPERRGLMGVSEADITTKIDVAAYLEVKRQAWTSHATQQNPNSIIAKMPPELFEKFRMTENLVLAETRLPRVHGVEEDVFAGLG
jgi:LmbE family N-acetylglucosaminyl deacetylase